MFEVWLCPNRRALAMGMSAPALLAAIGVAVTLVGGTLPCAIGWTVIGFAVLLSALLLWQIFQPRLAYEPGSMLVYLRLGSPIRVPIDLVEGFFLGSGPLRLSDRHSAPFNAVGLIIRLAEKAADWADRPVKPALGRWAEGYITIHGAWCEPLSLEVVTRLNVRLHDIQHAAEGASAVAETAAEKTP
jgi:hypothetical protein